MHTSGTLGVRVRLRGRVDKVRVRLNGHVADRGLTGGAIRRGPLTSADGLRFGRNVLRITAWRESGTWDRARRVVFVSRSRPLAAAGRDRRIRARARIRLDARASRSHRPGHGLSYSWRVLRRPKGPPPRLLRRGSARPTFVPRRPGRYRLRLTVRSRGRHAPASSDTVDHCVQPNIPPSGAVFDTRDTQNGIPGFRVGDATYQYYRGQVGLLVLDRCSLTPVKKFGLSPGGFGFADYKPQLADIVSTAHQTGRSYLVFLAADPGVAAPLPPNYSTAGFSAMTVVGRTSNPDPAKPDLVNDGRSIGHDPTEHLDQPGELKGNLQLDNTFNYTLVPPIGPKIATKDASGGGPRRAQMTVGEATFTSDPVPQGQAGFMVLALDRTALVPMSDTPATLVVNAAGGGSDRTLQGEMATKLRQLSDQGHLVLIQSIGNPKPTTPAWGDIARAIGSLGGTPHVFNTLDGSGPYALVGCGGCSWPDAQEASYPMTKPDGAGELSGRLGLDEGWRWRSRVSDLGFGLEYNLADIAALPRSNWPCGLGADNKPVPPAACSDGHEAALSWITDHVLFSEPDNQTPDSSWCQQVHTFRASYCSTKPAFTGITEDLNGKGVHPIKCSHDADGEPFTAQQCDEVRRELLLELEWRESVHNWFSNARSPLADAKSTDFMNLTAIENSIAQATPLDKPQGDATPSMLEFMASTLTVLSFLPGEEIPEVLGDLADAITLMSQTTTDQNAMPAFDKLEVTSSDLTEAMITRYGWVALQLALFENQFLYDYEKLKRAADLPGLNDPLDEKLKRPLKIGGIQWIWQTLLPKAYTLYKFRAPPPGRRLNDLNCLPQSEPLHPFSPLSDNESWTPVLGFDDSMRPQRPLWFAPGIGDLIAPEDGRPLPNLHFEVPDGRMFDKLWSQPPSDDPSAPALWEPWFHQRAEWLRTVDYSVGRFPVLSTSTMCWYGTPGQSDYHEP